MNAFVNRREKRDAPLSAAQQLTKAVQTAKKNNLARCHVLVRYPDDVRRDYDVIALPDAPTAIRGIEVEISDRNALVVAVVGDHEDGRKNVIFVLE